jgi:hypothetical protein
MACRLWYPSEYFLHADYQEIDPRCYFCRDNNISITKSNLTAIKAILGVAREKINLKLRREMNATD